MTGDRLGSPYWFNKKLFSFKIQHMLLCLVLYQPVKRWLLHHWTANVIMWFWLSYFFILDNKPKIDFGFKHEHLWWWISDLQGLIFSKLESQARKSKSPEANAWICSLLRFKGFRWTCNHMMLNYVVLGCVTKLRTFELTVGRSDT